MAIDRETIREYALRLKDHLTLRNGFRVAAIGLAMLGPGAVGTVEAQAPKVIETAAPAAVPAHPDAPYRIVHLSRADCRAVVGLATMHFKAEKPGALSAEFVDSLTHFVSPDGKIETCDGTLSGSSVPTIIVKTTRDFGVWGAIEGSGRSAGIDIGHAVL
jgi:hypothetical protein